MSALFSLSCHPSLSNPQPALFFIPLCYAAVTHLLGQQMEQGKHSMSVLWCTHSFFLSLFLSLSCLSLFFFSFESTWTWNFPWAAPWTSRVHFFLSSWEYNHIGFINPPVGKRFPVATVLRVTAHPNPTPPCCTEGSSSELFPVWHPHHS